MWRDGDVSAKLFFLILDPRAHLFNPRNALKQLPNRVSDLLLLLFAFFLFDLGLSGFFFILFFLYVL